jgi:hypothetical protein
MFLSESSRIIPPSQRAHILHFNTSNLPIMIAPKPEALELLCRLLPICDHHLEKDISASLQRACGKMSYFWVSSLCLVGVGSRR